VIRHATAADLDEVRALFREYQAELDTPLCFQTFEHELATLPGAYDPILIVPDAACVALRPLSPDVGEMKRLYVRPEHRGTGLGRRLTEAVIGVACAKGYRRLRLDTLPKLTTALAMYRNMGFREIARYNDNPVPGVVYLELTL
jgi:GNAT superfamily N-acetyltransferase